MWYGRGGEGGNVRRKLFTFAALLSLLLLVVTAVLWVRSYRVCDEIFLRYRVDGSERLAMRRGRLLVQHFRPDDGTRGRLIKVSYNSTALPWIPPTGWPEMHRIEIPILNIWFVNIPPP